ncbi:hypothetical protein FRC05_010417 [Tulasnella sp. 425]|nr:hypothetical protein FRC05_010417 [Tulasnella sp. 425]
MYTRKEDFKTTEIHLDVSGTSISFVKPGTSLPQDSSDGSHVGRSMVKAHIVFEPL